MGIASFACAGIFALLAAVSGIASANPDPRTIATTEFERAKASYASGDFVAASAAFQRAFELDTKSDYLFGWAQSERKRGNCVVALELYRKLMAMELEADQREATRLAMQRCEAEPTKPDPVKPPTPPRIVDPPPPRDTWVRDWRGHAITGTGIVLIGVGTWLTLKSVSDERAARDAQTFGEHENLGKSARRFRIAGIATLGAGVVVGALGVYRYATGTRRRPTIGLWLAPGGAGLAVGGLLP